MLYKPVVRRTAFGVGAGFFTIAVIAFGSMFSRTGLDCGSTSCFTDTEHAVMVPTLVIGTTLLLVSAALAFAARLARPDDPRLDDQ